MLRLKQVTMPYEFLKCHISGELIGFGDFYFEDDTDGLIVKQTVYHELKERRRQATFDYSKLERATSEREYREMLKQAQRQLKTDTLLDRKFQGDGAY